MEAKVHKDYIEEKERLDYVKQVIKEEREMLHNRTYNGLSEAVIPHMVYMDNQRMKKLNKSTHNPYFGRIDFNELTHNTIEKIYIGKTSITDYESDNEEDMLVVDWRAPISSLYYDRNIGNVEYTCPAGTIAGELLLKRNYKIENGHLEKITEIDVTAMDDILLDALEDKKDTKLKDIVSTIQSEQNEIIRADLTKSLIIQGVAGSGKTTIALHRIAYLIYTYQHRYSANEFLIIAPNQLFLQYIENMLPELGVEDVEQTTIEILTRNILSEEFYIREKDDKLKKIIEDKRDNEYGKSLRDLSRLKTSLKYKEMLDEYVYGIINEILPKEDLFFQGVLLIEASKLADMFYENYKRYSVLKSVKLIKKLIITQFENSKNDIEDSIYQDIKARQIQLEKTRTMDETLKEDIVNIYHEQQRRLKNMKKEFIKQLNTYLIEPKKSILKYYERFLKSDKCMKNHIFEKSFIGSFREKSKTIGTKKIVDIEDLPALLYLQHQLKATEKISNVKHIVIDEGQDFGTFQFYVLKELMKEATFTILGDIAQGIHYHRGTSDWNEVLQQVFKEQCQIKYLKKSYIVLPLR